MRPHAEGMGDGTYRTREEIDEEEPKAAEAGRAPPSIVLEQAVPVTRDVVAAAVGHLFGSLLLLERMLF